MSKIHPTSIVDKTAEIHDSVEIGPYCIVGPKVKIESNTILMSHVRMEGPTTIGSRNTFFPFTFIGADPQDLKYKGEESELIIGNDNTIRECVTLNRGTTGGGNVTRIGNNCLIMAYTHLGHDTIVEDEVIIANAVQVAGHVTIKSGARIGGSNAITQFNVVGELSFTGGISLIHKDLPPYVIAVGNPIVPRGINKVGLERKGISENVIKELTKAYKIFFMKQLTVKEAEKEMRETCDLSMPETAHFLEFILMSKNGVAR